MVRRWGALVAALALVGMLIWLPASRSQAQSGATPAASPGAGLSLPGAAVQTLASGTADQLPSSAPLALERIALAPGSTTGMRQISAPELLAIESGSLTVTDSLGLTSTLAAGQQQLVGANASYEASNDSTSPVSFLRLRLGEGEAARSEATSALGTPVSGTPAAAPSVTVLFNGKESNLPSGAGLLFIAQATFDPNADSGNHTSTGPIGIAATQGTLTVGTSSGIQGQLQAGKGVVLPSGTVYRLRNQSTDQVQALIAGVVAANGPAVQPVVPTPTPTLVPTETPIPTSTPLPTQTPIPTSTPLPPTPTAIPTTAAGTILQSGESWLGTKATLTISATSRGSMARDDLILDVIYQNTSDQRVDFVVPSGVFRVYDDLRSNWEPSGGDFQKMTDSRVILDPGEKIEYTLNFEAPVYPGCDYTANVFIAVRGLGAVDSAEWGVTFNKCKIMTLPPGVKDPTLNSASGQGMDTSLDGGGSSGNDVALSTHANPMHIADMLPNQGDLTAGFVESSNQQRSLTEVTQGYPDRGDAVQQFTNWGWKGNVVRSFNASDAAAPPGGVSSITVSIHRFGSAAGATAALAYWANAFAASGQTTNVTPPSLGDSAQELMQTTDQGRETALLVQRKDVVVGVFAFSPSSDPTSIATEVMETVLAK